MCVGIDRDKQVNLFFPHFYYLFFSFSNHFMYVPGVGNFFSFGFRVYSPFGRFLECLGWCFAGGGLKKQCDKATSIKSLDIQKPTTNGSPRQNAILKNRGNFWSRFGIWIFHSQIFLQVQGRRLYYGAASNKADAERIVQDVESEVYALASGVKMMLINAPKTSTVFYHGFQRRWR